MMLDIDIGSTIDRYLPRATDGEVMPYWLKDSYTYNEHVRNLKNEIMWLILEHEDKQGDKCQTTNLNVRSVTK